MLEESDKLNVGAGIVTNTMMGILIIANRLN